MTARELGRFKAALEKKLIQLQNDSAKLGPKEASSPLSDVNDQATRESERGFDMKLKDRQRGLIREIQLALRKVAEGTYGVCESCGDEIDVKRLQVTMTAALCISCKKELEEGADRNGVPLSPSKVA
jgi:DnaK suppressor protein